MKLKYIALLAAAFSALTACDGLVSGGTTPDSPDLLEGEVVLTASKTLIKADGKDATTFEVLVGGVPVTEGFTFYDSDNNRLELPDMKFTTDTPGVYGIWVSYGTRFSETFTISAIALDPPVLPEDPEPENLSFYPRVFITQFTGTSCGYCPLMTASVRAALEDEYWAEHTVLTAAHTRDSSDPAYLSGNLGALSGNSYPTLVGNLIYSTGYYNTGTARSLMELVEERTETVAGLSVASVLDGNLLAVLVSVKAAETREYKVGAWLLEDGIYGKQANYQSNLEGDFDTHDNCVRIAASRPLGQTYAGFELGEIPAGETAEYIFVMELKEEWVVENLHLAAFASVYDADLTSWVVNNAVGCGIEESLAFEYE